MQKVSRDFVLDELEYSVGPYGSSDAVTGPPCAVVAAVIWIAAVVWEATTN